MDDKAYQDMLFDLLEGEAFGEAFFGALAQQPRNPESQTLWRLASTLEAVTYRRLRPLIEREQGDVDAITRDGTLRGEREATGYVDQSCHDIATYFQTRAINGLARLRALEAQARPDDVVVMKQVTAHSVAFGSFINAWLANDLDGAAQALRLYIEKAESSVLGGLE
ncbi:MAG: hypothetical protein AAF493_26375 [Pseudomonadota bacterium]